MSDTSNKLELKEAKLLIIEDNPNTTALLKQVLRIEGYKNVVSTLDPCEIKTSLKDFDGDLILLDLMMPKMDGFEVMAHLKASREGTLPPILIITAQDDQEHRIRALSEGALDFVSKPFNRVELLTRIRNLLRISLSEKALRNQNEILEEKVQSRTKALYFERLQTLQLLGRTVEYRDNETGLHTIRISKISAMLGRAAGLSGYECDLLLNASPMHDIGKIGIPDRILFKPGRLDTEEWEIMKTHTTIGADILSGYDSELLECARIIALGHHERWDGSGYPSGLSGEKIPLVGRIVAITDVFDALSSGRKYKAAWTIDETVKEIEKGRGRHFDPVLVDHFMDLLPQIIKIKEAYKEPQ